MIQALVNENAFTGFQTDLRSGRNGIAFTVGVDFHVRFIIDFFVWKTIVDADQYVAAAAVDDVLGLEPMEMIRCVLPFLQVQQLFRIDLRILVRHGTISVADRDKRKTKVVKVALPIIRDVPAEHAIAYFIIFVPLAFPFLRRKMAKRRQVAMLLCAHSLELFQRFVDLTALHNSAPFHLISIFRLRQTVLFCAVRRPYCRYQNFRNEPGFFLAPDGRSIRGRIITA